MTRKYIVTNGINTKPEDVSWVDEFAEWCHSRGIPCDKNEIDELGSILRWHREPDRVAALAKLMDRRIPSVAVGHSYGARLSILAANAAARPPVELHLVSGAFVANSDKSGLNEYLRRDPEALAYIYRGGSDEILRRLTPASRVVVPLAKAVALLGRVVTLGYAKPTWQERVGYGDAGLIQPVANYAVDPAVAERVIFRDVAAFGHSDFLRGSADDAQSNLVAFAHTVTQCDCGGTLFDREFTAAEGDR